MLRGLWSTVVLMLDIAVVLALIVSFLMALTNAVMPPFPS